MAHTEHKTQAIRHYAPSGMPSSIPLREHWMLSSATKYRIWLSFIGCGKNFWRTVGQPLAWALSSSPPKAEIPRISDSWQKGWGWGGGKKPGGVFYSPHQSPHLRIYHCLTLLPLPSCVHKPPNKVSPLRVRQGISPGIERMGAALSRHLYHPMSR